jgi:hypothetical protein
MRVVALLLILSVALVVSAQTPDKNRGWRPGTYRGLTVGKSTRRDMFRVLGKPKETGPLADQEPPYPIVWNGYGTLTGELSGHLSVTFDRRTDRIVGISIAPENMSKEQAIKIFGDDYTMMGYEFCPDESLGATVGTVYENPKDTESKFLEYRPRGIYIHINYLGNVNSIEFVDGPIGLASFSDCKKVVSKARSRGRS